MEVFTIKHTPFIIVRRVLGVICLLCTITWFILHIGSLKIFDWIYFISFAALAGSLITNGFGTEKSIIQADEGYLKIKWMNRFRPILFQESEIEKIMLTRYKLKIFTKGGKTRNIALDFLERDQKKELYVFFIEYAKQKDIELVRDF
jgi:hypothetical protein